MQQSPPLAGAAQPRSRCDRQRSARDRVDVGAWMRVSRQDWPRPAGGSGNANGNRLRNPDHAVEHLSGYGDFTLLGREPAGAQLRSDDRLVSADRGLRETAPAVAGRFLPGHAALLCDDPNVAIALALRLGVLRARHRRRTWRNDKPQLWIRGEGIPKGWRD